ARFQFWWSLSPDPIRAFTSSALSCSGETSGYVPPRAFFMWSWTAASPPGFSTGGMFGQIEITPFHWAGFIIIVLLFLSLDLGVFHRHAHVVQLREALIWSTIWCLLWRVSCGVLVVLRGGDETFDLFSAYVMHRI